MAKNSGSGNKSNGGSSAKAPTPMTPSRASAIQRTVGAVKAGSFPARAQKASALNVNAGIVPAAPIRKP